jgi:hypothetical protein
VFAEIPLEDRIVLHSINHGIPYMIAPGTDRKLPLYQQTSALAEQLIEALEMQTAELIPDLSESAQRRPLG